MFFAWIALAIIGVGILAWIGASVSRRAPGTDWQEREDRPILPGEP